MFLVFLVGILDTLEEVGVAADFSELHEDILVFFTALSLETAGLEDVLVHLDLEEGHSDEYVDLLLLRYLVSEYLVFGSSEHEGFQEILHLLDEPVIDGA